MATAFGVFTGILGTISFLQSNIPSNDGTSSKVRVFVGLDGTQGLTNAGGDAPDIRQFNNNPEFLGAKYDPGHIGSGTYKDIKIGQSRQQPVYTLLTANNDAICIAYMTTTWPDGSQYAFAGNWGHTCGQDWYYSGVYQDNKELECVWIDGNGDRPVTAFHVKWPEFNENEFATTDSNNIQSKYCDSPNALNFQYGNDPGTIYYKRDAADSTRSYPPPVKQLHQKAPTSRRSIVDNCLVKTSRPSQSARTLCESETSSGPNFVNLAEGLYCDMQKKELMPTCTGIPGETCFDVVRLARKVDGIIGDLLNFVDIIDWGNGTDLFDTADKAVDLDLLQGQ
ncbi:hypothetical protein D6C89_01929 [Aureobasidium pullulans]|nr:hypothetical protein D6C89_01929 [Aureobasidium pullulans]